jgi:magnesium transporter
MKPDKVILEQFIVNHSMEASRLLEEMSFEQVFSFIEKIPEELAVVLFNEMDVYSAYKCLEALEVQKSVEIIEALPINTAVSFLRRMNKIKREEILEKSEKNISRLLTQMLYHAEDTVGALMDPQMLVIPSELNVKEAFERVKKSKNQTLNYLYVTNSEGKLLGIVKLEDLIASESKKQITSVMNSGFPHLNSEVEAKKIINHPGWFEYNALPVLDRSGVFLGALNQKVIRKVELESTKKVPRQAILAGNALGELYRIGLTGLLNSALAINKQTD